MEVQFLHRIRNGLEETRSRLAFWLQNTPFDKKSVFLGPMSEGAVRHRLETIDQTIAKVESGTIGKCEVCHGEVEPGLLEVDYTACVCLEHFSDEERSHLQKELELAQSIQRMLLPQEAPQIPGIEVAAYSRPSQIVGGDYFDFVQFENGRFGLIIADVAGHGVSSSLLVASVQALLRSLAPQSASVAELIGQIHKLMIHNIRYATFVSFFIGAYDTAARTLTYCNAGHPPQLVVRNAATAEDEVVQLHPTGAAIGLVEEAEFAEKTVALQPGDAVVLYTDGVTEAANDRQQMFGRQHLAELAKQLMPGSAFDMVQGIRKDLELFSQGRPLADDTTIVAGKITA